eukprot:g1799.t1
MRCRRQENVLVVLLRTFAIWISFLLVRTSPAPPRVHVHVLAASRPASLLRLLRSLNNAYVPPKTVIQLTIHVDLTENEALSRQCVRVARDFASEYVRGSARVDVSDRRRGLRDSWLNLKFEDTALVLEDDIVLSPRWYEWLTGAWERYGHRDDLAGITLQRQSLIPTVPPRYDAEIVNDHEPFLFPLPGSIGFSPHRERWNEFLEWIASVDLERVDVSVPGVSASRFVSDRSEAWTPYFVRFCATHALSTLYVNLPNGETLAAHMRERGTHFPRRRGQDFALRVDKGGALEFPLEPPAKYDWDGANLARWRHVVVAATASMLPFVRNWWSYVREWVLVSKTRVRLLALGPNVCGHVEALVCEADDDDDDDGRTRVFDPREVAYDSASYRRAVRRKLARYASYLELHVKDGEFVLFSDVDVVWRRGVNPFLAAGANEGSPPLLFSSDAVELPPLCLRSNAINSGVFFVRAGAMTRDLLRNALALLDAGHSPDRTDQGAIATALQSSDIPYAMLPCDTFANVRVGGSSWVSMHANWIRTADEKAKHLRSMGLWKANANVAGT